MSIETQLVIKATFDSVKQAQTVQTLLKTSLTNHDDELASALNALHPIDVRADFAGEEINVETIKRRKKVITISAYTYSSEEPTWFMPSFYALGAVKTVLRC